MEDAKGCHGAPEAGERSSRPSMGTPMTIGAGSMGMELPRGQ